MIKEIKGYVKRSSHYGASEADMFCLEVIISVDSKAYNSLKKKQDPVQGFLVSLKNIVYDATQIDSLPHFEAGRDSKRAKNGLKTIRCTFYITKGKASQLGADVKNFCLYHKIDLQSHLENNKSNTLFAKSAIDQVLKEHENKLKLLEKAPISNYSH